MSSRKWLASRFARWGALASLLVLLLVCVGISVGQYRDYGRRRIRTIEEHRRYSGVPTWELDKEFKQDVFTFVRVQYDSWRDWRGGKWRTDYPDSDWNFSFRLQQLTSLKVDPEGKILRLTDEELFDHPWIYMIEPGSIILSDAEVVALRKYLLNGGFLMVDDFWGEEQWRNFYSEFQRVFPDRDLVDLTLDHEIFHCVYDLEEMPQVPSINYGRHGRSYETWDSTVPHYRALYDDNQRMMAIICHNTDLGDGWEREGVDPYYFQEYSEKQAYPLGINIVVYAMTH